MKTDNNVMKNESKHTKGLWRLSAICPASIIAGNNDTDNRIDIACCDITNTIKLFDNTPENKEAKANAAFIVKAVNNHYKLIEALKEIDNTAICFADDHKHYYDNGNENKINSMLAELHNAHLKAKQLLNEIEKQ